jgi:hypothetical protein
MNFQNFVPLAASLSSFSQSQFVNPDTTDGNKAQRH